MKTETLIGQTLIPTLFGKLRNCKTDASGFFATHYA